MKSTTSHFLSLFCGKWIKGISPNRHENWLVVNQNFLIIFQHREFQHILLPWTECENRMVTTDNARYSVLCIKFHIAAEWLNSGGKTASYTVPVRSLASWNRDQTDKAGRNVGSEGNKFCSTELQ